MGNKANYSKQKEAMRIAHKMYKKRFYTNVPSWKICLQEAWYKVKTIGLPSVVKEDEDIDNLDFAMF